MQGCLGVQKRFVYILRSEHDPEKHYVGVTSELHERLQNGTFLSSSCSGILRSAAWERAGRKCARRIICAEPPDPERFDARSV